MVIGYNEIVYEKMCSSSDYKITSNVVEVMQPEMKLEMNCKKCTVMKAAVVLQKKHTYCRTCFLYMVTHKFRSTIGKNKVLRSGDKVLCVCTGSQSCVALLHLLQRGTNEPCGKKIRFQPAVLFIDESVLWPKSSDVRSILLTLFDTLKQFGFPCYVTKLSSIYQCKEDRMVVRMQDIEVAEYVLLNESDIKLLSLFQRVTSVTSKIDLLLKLRKQVWSEIASVLHYQNVFTPECATDLSVRLLSDIALGRGSQIPCDVAFCDERNLCVRFIRPLREITSKEVVFYNLFNGMESLDVPSFAVMFDSLGSVQSETESFLRTLQGEFPSTVYTVFRVGDKLKMTEKKDVHTVCPLCRNISVLPSNSSECFQCNLRISDDELVEYDECDKNVDEDVYQKLNRIFANSLCYSCGLIVKDMKSPIHWPSCLIRNANVDCHVETTRKRIQDFLL